MRQRGNSPLIILILFIVVVAGLAYLLYSKGYFGMGQIANVATNQETAYRQITGGNTGVTSSTSSTSETGNVTSPAISITITSPQNGATLSSGTVTVTGKTSPNADVFVNDQEVHADASGNFSAKIDLDEGQNEIIVTANDAYGNAAEQDINVTVQSFQ
jgi:cytoskeletal protein RodZ